MLKRNIAEINTNNNNNITIDELNSTSTDLIADNDNLKNNNFIATNISESSLKFTAEFPNENLEEDLIKSTKKLKILKICHLDTNKTCFDLHLRIVKLHIGTYILFYKKIKFI